VAKNDPLSALVRDLPRILAWDLIVVPYAVVRERLLLRGYVEAARLLPRMLRKRRQLQSRRVCVPPYGLVPPT
jgi:hypothetical protein